MTVRLATAVRLVTAVRGLNNRFQMDGLGRDFCMALDRTYGRGGGEWFRMGIPLCPLKGTPDVYPEGAWYHICPYRLLRSGKFIPRYL